MAMPKQKPGRSKQDYRTPPEFLRAVKTLLGINDFDCDLAASDENTVTHAGYITAKDDALAQPTWNFGDGWNWLNPEFSNIGPWVHRAYEEALGHWVQTAVLIPASIGANWWRDHVHGKAMVLGLNGRLKFVGCDDYYPKDCALLLYSPSHIACIANGDWPYDIWTWGKDAQ